MAVAELGGAGVELGGDFPGGGRGAGGGPFGPRGVLAGVGEVEALEASVEDAGDGPGAVEGGAGDLGNEGAEVVSGEAGGAQCRVEGLAGVFLLVACGLVRGECGGDVLVDLGVDGGPDGGGPEAEEVPGSAGPFLGLPDGFGGGQLAGVALHDAGEHGFGGGLLVGLLAGRCGAAGDDVGGVGFAAAAHPDVQGLPGQ